MRTSRSLCACLGLLLCLPAFGQTEPTRPEAPPQQKKEAPRIHIVVVEGDGAINSIKQHSGKDLVVRVEDEDSHPVKGAMVTFQLPDLGPSGRLADGGTMATIATNAQGVAHLRGLQPNNVQGDLHIKVSASFSGQTASTDITQTNVEAVDATTATPTASRGSNKALWILLIAGGAGGAIAAAAAGHHGSSTSSITPGPTPPPATGIVITPGTPAVGGPH